MNMRPVLARQLQPTRLSHFALSQREGLQKYQFPSGDDTFGCIPESVSVRPEREMVSIAVGTDAYGGENAQVKEGFFCRVWSVIKEVYDL